MRIVCHRLSLLAITVALSAAPARAQNIASVSVSPVNPTAGSPFTVTYVVLPGVGAMSSSPPGVVIDGNSIVLHIQRTRSLWPVTFPVSEQIRGVPAGSYDVRVELLVSDFMSFQTHWETVATTNVTVASVVGGAFGPVAPLTPEPTMGGQQVPAIVLTGTGLATLWRDDQGTHVGFLDSSPPIAEERASLIDPVSYRDAAVAALGSESYVIWVENDWLYGFVMDSSGHARTEPRLLWEVDSRHTTRIAVAASSNQYLVVMNAWSKVMAFLVDRDGNRLNFTDVIPGGGTHAVDRVSVASDGDQFLVVWDESSNQPWVTPCAITCPTVDGTVHAIVVGSDGFPKSSTETNRPCARTE